MAEETTDVAALFARLKAASMAPAGLKQAQLWLDRQIRDYIRAETSATSYWPAGWPQFAVAAARA